MTTTSPTSRTTGRTLDLFEFVLSEGETNLTGAAQAVDLTPTTALRHLKSLEARGYVQRDDFGTFSAGPTFLRLAAAALQAGPHAHLIALVRPHLQSLAAQTGESAYLAIMEDGNATYLATVESRRAIRHMGWLGRKVPLTGTAVGEALKGEDGIRIQVGAVEPDITAAAVSIRTRLGVVAALSVVGPTHRMNETELAQAAALLRRSAEQIAEMLGRQPETAR